MADKHRIVEFTQPDPGTGYARPMFRRESFWSTGKEKIPRSYRLVIQDVRLLSGPYHANGVDSDPTVLNITDLGFQLAYNKAYGKFVEKLGERSQWAVNLAERKQTVRSIVTRATQLVHFTRQIKRLDFVGAAKTLRVPVPRSIGPKVKWKDALSDAWLEYHFGWEPLIKDIGAGIATFNDPILRSSISTRGQEHLVLVDSVLSSSNYRITDHAEADFRVRIGARVVVRDSLTAQLNQLGFLNPLGIAWELVPFSFVVDWFANVGQILGSSTDFAGFTIDNQYVSYYGTSNRTYSDQNNNFPQNNRVVNARYVKHTRNVGSIPGPTLQVKPFRGFSLARGATAISLLLQQMRRL